MAGIISYGAYIPFYRLSRSEIAKAWGIAPQPGERAVANYDEDSLTMAVAAAMNCVNASEAAKIGALYFASTTAPYKEKQCAATVATVLGLPKDAITMDFGGSLRCGSNALKSAVDAVESGAVSSVLVCVADTRMGYPMGPGEMSFGDGAAALLIGKTGVMAEITNFSSRYHDIQDIWRSDRDQFVRSAEDRFAQDEGYTSAMIQTISAFLKKASLTPKDFARIAIYSPNARQHSAIAQKLGFDVKIQAPDIMHSQIGDTGSAMSIMSLIGVLEDANQGEMILMASYGNGSDVFALKTTGKIAEAKNMKGIKKNLASKGMINNYSKTLRWRELVQTQPAQRPPIEERQPTPAAQWRDLEWDGRLTGTKCLKCGTPQYPKQRVCIECETKDQYVPYTFFDKPAKVFSFSHDYVMQTVDPPVTVTIVNFEGGGRIMCDMTDRDPDSIKVGLPLEMTFRRLYYVGGIYNYWWKCRPVRS
jgi:hydroxymethylglutaryl-CoA synthase